MAQQKSDDTVVTSIRLSKELKPIHYELKFEPNFVDYTFDGFVKIHYTSTKTSLNDVVLHANVLKIHEGSAESSCKSRTTTLNTVTYGSKSETAVLTFDDPIDQSGVISLKFSGYLDDKMKGLYRTSFKFQDSTGKNHTLVGACTQFAPTDARRCFPCFDEPNFKATFTVEVLHKKFTQIEDSDVCIPNVAISNMPIESETELPDGLVLKKFAKSPIMSTYLVAIVVGPFEYIEQSDGKRPIRVYTVPGKSNQGRFALEVASKTLRFYEDYFNIPYPLPKMDMFAAPDLSYGGMENWGLITYREVCVLFDPDNSAANIKQNVARVVAHEIAHQWFGNLVTMDWWTHLWLNEGFASFMQYLSIDNIYPELEFASLFVTLARNEALSLDALKNSHPIEICVNHPSEIDEIFDQISYRKGASIIKMLYNYIGDDCFRRGMHGYMCKFSYKNAITEDLWDALGNASNKPIRQMMSGWTSQKGFPYIKVSCRQKDDAHTELSLIQEKFNADGVLDSEEASVLWMCPIDAVLESDPQKTLQLSLLKSKTDTLTVPNNGGWIKLNSGSINFYHAAYSSEMLTKFKSAIESQKLGPMDRLDLLESSFALCRAGKTSLNDYLSLMDAFARETHHSVIVSIDSCMGYLNNILSQTDLKDKFHAYGRALYSVLFKRFTWEPQAGESHTDAMTRPILINGLITFKDQSVIDEALRRFEAQISGSGDIPADLRSAVYKVVATYGSDEAFEELFKMHQTATQQEELNRIVQGMALTLNENRRKRIAEYVFTDHVRNQDKASVIISISSASAQSAFNILVDKRETLISIYGSFPIISRLIKAVASKFVSLEKANEIEAYFKLNNFPGAERSIQQSIETVRLNSQWLERDLKAFEEYLSQRY